MKCSVEFECGEKTCAVEPGKFCRFVVNSNFGRKFFCSAFFDSDRSHQVLEDKNGWLMRCQQCLDEQQKWEKK